MHTGIDCLQQVIQLSRHEFALLDEDDAEKLAQSAQQRERLLQDAWQKKDGCDEQEFARLLHTVKAMQTELAERATALMRETRAELDQHKDMAKERKKTTHGILGYCKVGLDRPKTNARIFRKFS